MKKTGWLRDVFDWIREVIDSADGSIVLTVLVVLPFLVPIVPAWVTSINLHDLMGFPTAMSNISGLTIELLGFSAAILALKSITRYSQAKEKRQLLLQMLVDVGAWLFYLVAVVAINIVLDNQNGKPFWYVLVVGILCLLSIPSGMLAASRINTREQDEKENRLRQERREDKKERERVRSAERIANTRYGSSTGSGRTATEQIRTFVKHIQDTEKRTPGPSEIAARLGVSKSHASETMSKDKNFGFVKDEKE